MACALTLGACGSSHLSLGGDDGRPPSEQVNDSGTFNQADGGFPQDDGGASMFGMPDAGVIYSDFPHPVFDTPDGGSASVPPNAPALFGAASQGAKSGGPCMVEPEPSALFPRNWLRPRFRWNAVSGQNLFELRLHVQNQTSDLVVYTTATTWTMPSATWDNLRRHSSDVAITASIRAGTWSGGGQLAQEALGSNQAWA